MTASEEQKLLEEITLIQGRSSPQGKVDVLIKKATGKCKLRFHAVALDQVSIILLALENARDKLGTAYDSVALEAICIGYLTTEINFKQ